jgi:sugar transferase (PEP-CTERM/EpsH1 system associated)
VAALKGVPGPTARAGTGLAALPPLVLHIVYRFDVGGLENGVVNLINHMPQAAYRHAVLALTEVTDFKLRIRRQDLQTLALHKPPGHGVWQYGKLWRLMRRLRPAVVHTRNLAALEAVVPAWAAGVPVRVHGEHGREGRDLAGAASTYDRVRRLYRPFVSHYVALSADLATYLRDGVGVPNARLSHVYNGVDTEIFTPAAGGRPAILGCPFQPNRHWLVGTVGRMQPVKDQVTLARAFVRALQLAPELRARMRLVIVGDGPLRTEVMEVLRTAGVDDCSWMPGERNDVADIMRGLHCFALSSRSEGISNVVLEAMATALPVLATRVGGNPELVSHGRTGELVPPSDPDTMALALVRLASDPQRSERLGLAARADVHTRFSLAGMVDAYQGLYDRLLHRAGPSPAEH